jgi:hypothetical protein
VAFTKGIGLKGFPTKSVIDDPSGMYTNVLFRPFPIPVALKMVCGMVNDIFALLSAVIKLMSFFERRNVEISVFNKLRCLEVSFRATPLSCLEKKMNSETLKVESKIVSEKYNLTSASLLPLGMSNSKRSSSGLTVSAVGELEG